MKCKTCIVQATCSKKHYEESLCEDVFKKMTKKIDWLRNKADILEREYGLQGYYYQKKEEDKNDAWLDKIRLGKLI